MIDQAGFYSIAKFFREILGKSIVHWVMFLGPSFYRKGLKPINCLPAFID